MAVVNSSNKPLRFVIHLALAYISWRVLMWVLGEQSTSIEERVFPMISFYWERLNSFMANILVALTSAFLETLGYAVTHSNRNIAILDSSGVGVGNYCLGLEMMYLYLSLIFFTPSIPLIRKLIFFIGGLLLIQLVNVMRMGVLAILVAHNSSWTDFNHYFTFRLVVFGVILLLYTSMLGKFKSQ